MEDLDHAGHLARVLIVDREYPATADGAVDAVRVQHVFHGVVGCITRLATDFLAAVDTTLRDTDNLFAHGKFLRR